MFIYEVYEFNVKLKKQPASKFMFSRTIKIELMHVHWFYNKTEVAGTTTMTQCLSSRDPTEKSGISHSYISVSSSEDAGVEHSGDLH